MAKVLYLVHRIPYPPNKGDKIRSFNILKRLAESFSVHLGAFVDDPADWKYVEDVRKYCAETCLLSLNPNFATLRSLTGLLTGKPLTLPYYYDRRMAEWTGRTLAEGDVSGVLVFSSAMAQYVSERADVPRIIDFVDVDADKWRQYAERKPWPANLIYQREAQRLLQFDSDIACRFDRSLFVSAAEAALFTRLAPNAADRVMAVENGVDTIFFDGTLEYENPYPHSRSVVVFTGAMDYWANIDAVTWFADAVFSELRRRLPGAEFFIVGARPTEAVVELGRRDGITVTGGVKDIRPYLRHAQLAVAPLRIARGIQNKVLEAMAMGRVVLASSAAMEGIEAVPDLDVHEVVEPEEWVRQAVALLTTPGSGNVSLRNREFVVRRYGWRSSLDRLVHVLEG